MRRRITLRYGIALSICLGMASSPLCAAGVGARPGLDLVLMVDLEKFAADDLAPFRQSLLAQAA
ncbi:MAG: hypothetical protein ACN6P8_20335, partial [Achromobacter piechaudii]